MMCCLHHLLDSHSGWETILAGTAGSGCVGCCVFSSVCDILIRGGTCGAWSFCISSASVLVLDGLWVKGVHDRSKEVWRAKDESTADWDSWFYASSIGKKKNFLWLSPLWCCLFSFYSTNYNYKSIGVTPDASQKQKSLVAALLFE